MLDSSSIKTIERSIQRMTREMEEFVLSYLVKKKRFYIKLDLKICVG